MKRNRKHNGVHPDGFLSMQHRVSNEHSENGVVGNFTILNLNKESIYECLSSSIMLSTMYWIFGLDKDISLHSVILSVVYNSINGQCSKGRIQSFEDVHDEHLLYLTHQPPLFWDFCFVN